MRERGDGTITLRYDANLNDSLHYMKHFLNYYLEAGLFFWGCFFLSGLIVRMLAFLSILHFHFTALSDNLVP